MIHPLITPFQIPLMPSILGEKTGAIMAGLMTEQVGNATSNSCTFLFETSLNIASTREFSLKILHDL